MGTRADFYAGKGPEAEWLGSIAWDGYRSGVSGYVLKAKTEKDYRKAVEVFLKSRDDATWPKDGWPWPWNDSGTSDCSYWFFDGKCWDVEGKYESSGAVFVPCDEPEPDWGEGDEDAKREAWLKDRESVVFKDMTDKQNVTLGHRSGLLILGMPAEKT